MYFQQWKEYFELNQTHFAHINFSKPDLFCVQEQKLYTASLQQFQRGEHSEGKHLLQYAKQYGDTCYTDAIKLFIKEEQDHALVLGKFLHKHDLPRIKHHWVDGVFRFMRQLSGIENTISILLVAEIISKVYYKALQQATSSELLRAICEQILKDEEKHLHFQCATLRLLQVKSDKISQWLKSAYIKTVLTGTVVVVWKYHKIVLQNGGHTFKSFHQKNMSILSELLQMIKGQKEIPSALSEIENKLLIA
jgi:rubrerythrin